MYHDGIAVCVSVLWEINKMYAFDNAKNCIMTSVGIAFTVANAHEFESNEKKIATRKLYNCH